MPAFNDPFPEVLKPIRHPIEPGRVDPGQPPCSLLDQRFETAAIPGPKGAASAIKTFQWGRHFETGLDTVDEQHRNLVSLINRLGASFLAGEARGAAGDRELADAFAELAAYAAQHFADEERLMREAVLLPGYIARHEQIHAQFGEQLTMLWQSRRATGDTGEILLGFLVAWLGFHILGEDQDMAEQIAATRAGATPEAAFAGIGEGRGRDGRTAALIDALQALYRTLSLQNRELANANQRLEERVAARTRDLAASHEALQKAYRQMEGLARVDGLLGIANRRHFDERFDEEWRRAQRARVPLGLLMVDVDYFKRYNDAYGHQAGDDCLKAVAARVGGGRRPADLLARYGGEELVMLLPGTPTGGAAKVARDVCASVAQARIAHRDSPLGGHVTVSVGAAARTPRAGLGAAALLEAADRALYEAKARGRDRVVVNEEE